MAHARNTPRSEAAFARAQRVLVGGVNSPVRAFRAVGGKPIFLAEAEGAHVTDVDGNRYIDLVGSWGPMIAGHAHPEVIAAVREAAGRSLSFGACCTSEAELAELVVAALPSVEMVRFVNSGTEATMSAIRLIRAVTGRPKILKLTGCYHGHADGLLVAAGSGAATFGVPDSAGVAPEIAALTLLAPYNDLDAARALFDANDDIAGVLVEPIAGNMGFVKPVEGYLEGLRELCTANGSLLVFDEVMTGFRVAWGGYQNVTGVTPDVTCLGKVIGGGMPVAAYGARRDIMEHVSPVGRMYQAGTLSGNPVGMAAGLATLKLASAPEFYDRLGETSSRLSTGLARAAQDAGVDVQVDHHGGMLGMYFSDRPIRCYEEAQTADHARFAQFFQGMLRRGVWLPPSGYEAFFLSSAHDEPTIDAVIAAAADTFRELT